MHGGTKNGPACPGTVFSGGACLRRNSELVALLFSNLLSNAEKYASSGAVEVTLCRMGERCRFRISNGFNNAALDQERIWDPFYVGEPSRSRALTGTGLGLAIVKRIAEQYGYSVRCEIGEGRILFEVLFPAALKNLSRRIYCACRKNSYEN